MKKKVVVKSVVYRFGDFALDVSREALFFNEQDTQLSYKSIKCLHLLIKNAGVVVKKEDFLKEVWKESFVEDGVLAVNIANIRRTLENYDDSTKYIQTISRIGYRFIEKVEVIGADVTEILENPAISDNRKFDPHQTEEINKHLTELSNGHNTDSPTNKTSKKSVFITSKRRQFYLILGVCLVLASLAFGFLYYRTYYLPPVLSKPKKIAIFPFIDTSKTPDADYFSLAFIDSLNTMLYSLPNILVSSTTQMKKYVNKPYDYVEEGKNLGVEVVVTGTFYKTADKMTINVVVTDLSPASPIPQQKEFVSSNNDLANIQGQLIKFIVDSMNLSLTAKDLRELRKRETQNPLAYEYFLRGSNAHIKNNFEEAISYYNKSLEQDPDFEIVYENMAIAYLTKGNAFGCGEPCAIKATEYLTKIIQKSPNNYRAQVNLGQSLTELNKPEQALQVLTNVVEKDVNNSFAYNSLSYVYRYVGMLDNAHLMFEKSKNDQQYLLLIQKGDRFYDNALLYKGEYVRFLESMKDDPDTGISLFYKGLGHYYNRDFEKSKAAFNNSYQQMPDAMMARIGKSYVYHIEKNEGKGLELLEEVYQSLKKNRVYDGEMIYKTAQAFAVFKQKEKALELFDLSVEKGFFCYPYFLNDPLMNNVRNEPAFQTTLEKARKRHDEFKSKHPNTDFRSLINSFPKMIS